MTGGQSILVDAKTASDWCPCLANLLPNQAAGTLSELPVEDFRA